MTLLDPAGVAKVLGLPVATVYTYKLRGTLPPPTDTFGQTPVWDEQVIAKWALTRRSPGRPKATPLEPPAEDPNAYYWKATNHVGKALTGHMSSVDDLPAWVKSRWRSRWRSLTVLRCGVEVGGIGVVNGKRVWWAQQEEERERPEPLDMSGSSRHRGEER